MKLTITLNEDDSRIFEENFELNKERLKAIGIETKEELAALLCVEGILNLPSVIEMRRASNRPSYRAGKQQ